MYVGIGLLITTGILWGCTNPFVRQSTRGLAQLEADSYTALAQAETEFMLGNWKCFVPWAINQIGSLLYLLAVQQVPLTIAVPTANSIAFVFTAITASVVGLDERLDAGSIFGIILVGIGAALCCLDKT